nr:hypothetical protein [Tanacetum cinerariifolium]
KSDEEDKETGKGGDEVRESEGDSDEEETREEEEESFDPIPRTPEESEEDQDLRLSEEAKIQEEEDADELYRDVNINQGRGLQVTQNVEDTHVTLRVELIFTTTSSPIVSLQSQTPIMTPSTIATITTSGEAPIPPPTIPSIILENLPMFNLAFRFEERLRSLETSFSEYRQTNQFADAVSAIPGIVQQFMTQQMTEAVREAVQIQTDRLQDSLQRENDEFLRNIDENMKKIIKGKSKIKSRNKTSYAIAADLSEMELKKILIEKIEGNKSIQRSDEQRNLYKALVERMMIRKDPLLDQTRGLKDKKKEVSMHQLALHLKKQPRVQADQQQGLNLDKFLPVSLLLQRNLCRIPVRWRNPHIRCLRQVPMINQLFKHLSILNGFLSQGDHLHWIVLGIQLCQLLKEMLNLG